MDINRYYVPPTPLSKPKPQPSTTHENPALSGVLFRPKPRLPTPQAFYERQKQQKQREADQKAMMRFASRRTVKHNLRVRYDNLKHAREDLRDELNVKITGSPASGNKLAGKTKESEQEYLERLQARKEAREKERLQPGVNGFYLNDLEDALEEDDDYAINKSILEAFLEQYAPKRLHEVEDLLKEHKGNEIALFKMLAQEFRIDVGKSVVMPSTSKPVDDEEVIEKLEVEKDDNEEDDAAPPSPVTFKPVVKVAKETKAKSASGSPKWGVRPSDNFRKAKAAPVNSVRGSQLPPALESIKSLDSNNANKRASRLEVLSRHGSYTSLRSTMTMLEPQNEEMRQFQKALDEEIKAKQETGEYVVSIMESGGRWWVNRGSRKVHPSQRKRNTLLDALREGKVPISNENFAKEMLERKEREAAAQSEH